MTIRKTLLICGAVSSLLYVAIDVLAAIFFSGYHSFTSQAVSELMARGAPTERFADPLYILYDVLLIAFGVGVWMSAGGTRRVRVVAALLLAIGVAGFLRPTVCEMNMRGTADVQGDMPHLVLTAVMGLLTMLAMGIGAFIQGPRFRLFSFATLLTILDTGALLGVEARNLANGKPTPWFGTVERINIGAYLLWVSVLAVSFFRSQRSPEPESTSLSDFARSPTAVAAMNE